MDYDTAVSALFRAMPEDAPPPPPTVHASNARRLRDTMEPLSQHAVWSRHVHDILAKLGLTFVPAVVCGRATALGQPRPAVVVAVFGSFEPATLTQHLRTGWAACPPHEILSARETAAIDSLTTVLAGAEVQPVAAVLRHAVETVDGTGRPMFCGLRALPWPRDPVGELWRACEALRERRGDSHLAAYTAAGLHPLDMHTLSEPGSTVVIPDRFRR